jgi:hypothetical protein
LTEAVVTPSCACNTPNCNTYDVGPGQSYPDIASVPALTTLQPGDWICIHPSSTPYFEKFVINRSGTAEAPIVISGVIDETTGERPIIDGNGATTPLALNYWNEVRNLVKIGGASVPNDFPSYIRVQNLHLRNAHTGYSFTDDSGNSQSYVNNAACLHVEAGHHVDLVNNEIEGCGNGIFIGGDVEDVLIESNYIHNNGNVNRIYEHNTYTEALRITYRYNRFGPLCAGCSGNNLKDRSAGLVVSNNFIEGGNRQLDLVDSYSMGLDAAQEYETTHVYGNVLVEPDGAGNRQIVHFGGDSGSAQYYRR